MYAADFTRRFNGLYSNKPELSLNKDYCGAAKISSEQLL